MLLWRHSALHSPCQTDLERVLDTADRGSTRAARVFSFLRSGSAELLWLGAGAGARKKKFRCLALPAPAFGEGREKLEGAKSLLRRDAGTSREAIISSHPQTSPSRVTSPEARSSCGRDFGRSCCRPAPAGARLSEAPSCSTPREGAGRAQASATRRRIKRILQTSSLARQKDQTEL